MDDIQNQYRSSDEHREEVEDDETKLLDYFRVLSKYRWMILLICGIAGVATAIRCLSSPKVYSATTRIVPPMEILQRQSGLATGFGTGRSSMLRKAVGVTSIAEMYASILGSRAVADAIIDRLDLMTVYGEKEYRSNARTTLRGSSTIRVSSEGIVSITVKDRDPNRAAAIANAYVEELDKQNRRLSSGQATSKRVFLENRLKEIEQDLSGIEDLPSREVKIKEILLEMLSQEYEIAKIEEAKSMPTIQILDRAIVPEMRMPRGTKRKTLSAGFVSFVFAAFLAFAREHFAKMDNATKKQWRLLFKLRQGGSKDIAFSELESKRRIVATRRQKRAQEINHTSKSIDRSKEDSTIYRGSTLRG